MTAAIWDTGDILRSEQFCYGWEASKFKTIDDIHYCFFKQLQVWLNRSGMYYSYNGINGIINASIKFHTFMYSTNIEHTSLYPRL